MPASDLFSSAYDVQFRLAGTCIVVGKEVYDILRIDEGSTPRTTLIYLGDFEGNVKRVFLGQLPLSSMFNCPSGYVNGVWWCRGPARHRYQGIRGSSLWAVLADGTLMTEGVSRPAKVLRELAEQPRIRPATKRPSGVLTRDVYIDTDSSYVLVRGRYLADYIGRNKIRPIQELSPTTQELLVNARLSY